MDKNPYSRKKEPELNRQLIIEAAIDIGAESDWHQVTFQAIADKTGLSKGGIIHHFRNKGELLDELMNQSLIELTEWVEKYKMDTSDPEGAMGYLDFVLSKKKDAKYTKTMRIVLQAIMISGKYREEWVEWHKEHITDKGSGDLSTRSLIIHLVADGIWYTETMGDQEIPKTDRQRIWEYLRSI